MTLKSFIKLFIPPIVFKIINIIKGKHNIPIEKTIAYNYINDISHRSNLPFTDYEYLSKDYSFDQIKSISYDSIDPNFYGHFLTLEKYAGIFLKNFPPQKFTIQHGLLTDLNKYYKDYSKGKIFVWSKHIETMMRNIGCRNIWTTGAPFLYADSILNNEEIIKEKKRLGRNLLAFPMHSTHFATSNYSPENLLRRLHEEGKRFESVRVCLYWKDIQLGRADLYKKNGFEVVCAGHMFDQFFLQRLKSLLKIADATISNDVGSHIGYSISENIPHCLISDEFDIIDTQGNEEEIMYLKTQSTGYIDIKNAFLNNDDFSITSQQRNIVDTWWGLSQKKSQQDLKNMIYKCYLDED